MKLLIVILAAFFTPLPSTSDKNISNDLVDLEISVKQKEFHSGETGHFLITFKPKKGIHVTTDPAFEFTFDTLKQFFSAGKAEFAKDEKKYLKTRQPVKQLILVAAATPPGTYRVKGNLVYYYCSDDEGWCSRFKQPLELTLTVK